MRPINYLKEMKMKIRTYAAKLTDENLTDIVEYAKRHNLNLDYLQDTKEFNAEIGFETYVIMSVRTDEGYDPIVTFTEMADADFDRNYQLGTMTYLNLFKVIIVK